MIIVLWINDIRLDILISLNHIRPLQVITDFSIDRHIARNQDTAIGQSDDRRRSDYWVIDRFDIWRFTIHRQSSIQSHVINISNHIINEIRSE